MNLLTIKNGTNKWNLQMNHVKYIISDSSKNYTAYDGKMVRV